MVEGTLLEIQKRPCSHLLCSAAFGALPEQLKKWIYQRLWDILPNWDTSPTFGRIRPNQKGQPRDSQRDQEGKCLEPSLAEFM